MNDFGEPSYKTGAGLAAADTLPVCKNCLYCYSDEHAYKCYCMPDKIISVHPDSPGCCRGKDRHYNVCFSLPQTIREKRFFEEKEQNEWSDV